MTDGFVVVCDEDGVSPAAAPRDPAEGRDS